MAAHSRVQEPQRKRLDLHYASDFLGHDISVHRNFNRLPVPTIPLAKISKLLLSMEKGNLSSMQGKSLDEIEIEVSGFPNVIGCIDGTHIPIKAPSINEGDYVNRKSVHSINVQVICDATHLITNVEAKWPGSVHDARIFRESSLCNKFEQGHFYGYLLGDRGYPCLPYMMTPYPDPEPGPQTRFNRSHSRTRAKVEMTIGILKARFQCLRGLRVTPNRACDITVACVVLHNIATIRGERHPP
ncbi:putative nuclease HARBI1, partial [Pimephales promelas]|uniref:putative nuclease HARBI1 n=1 Tax=Pimephales promelas TaxID=90988 RepID=UPI001955E77C